MSETRVQLCGNLAASIAGKRIDDLPGRQGRLLFAFLVLERTRRTTRDELVDALWREPPPTADATLTSLVSRLRRALGEGVLEGRSDLRLSLPDGAWVDVEAALEGVHRAEAAVAQEDWHTAWLPAQVALHVTTRPFLPAEDLPWVDHRRRLLHQTRVRALECVASATYGLGGSELAAAERCARTLTELEPYRESGYRLLMEALAARDNVAEALLVYERLRVLLRDDLGVGPGARIQELHKELLARRS